MNFCVLNIFVYYFSSEAVLEIVTAIGVLDDFFLGKFRILTKKDDNGAADDTERQVFL